MPIILAVSGIDKKESVKVGVSKVVCQDLSKYFHQTKWY